MKFNILFRDTGTLTFEIFSQQLQRLTQMHTWNPIKLLNRQLAQVGNTANQDTEPSPFERIIATCPSVFNHLLNPSFKTQLGELHAWWAASTLIFPEKIEPEPVGIKYYLFKGIKE